MSEEKRLPFAGYRSWDEDWYESGSLKTFKWGLFLLICLHAVKLELVKFLHSDRDDLSQKWTKRIAENPKSPLPLDVRTSAWRASLQKGICLSSLYSPRWGGGGREGYSLIYFPGVRRSAFSVRFCSCLNVIFKSQAIHLVCITIRLKQFFVYRYAHLAFAQVPKKPAG